MLILHRNYGIKAHVEGKRGCGGGGGAGGGEGHGGEGGCYISTADDSNTAIKSSSVGDANLEHPTDTSDS